MKESEINKAELKNLIDNQYSLKVNKITHIPKGQSGAINYSVDSNKGKFFAKVLDSKNKKIKKRQKSIINFLYKANKDYHLDNISPPIINKNGKKMSSLKNQYLILFKFISGNPKHVGLSRQELEKLGETIGKVHKINPKKFNNIRKEDFSNYYNEDIFNKIREVRKSSFDELKKVLLNYEKIIEIGVKRRNELVKYVKSKKQRVIAHSDLHTDNFLINEKGIYILDWGSLTISQPEKDLHWFYDGGELNKDFLNGYKKIRKGFVLDERLLKYHAIQRSIYTIWVFTKLILENNSPSSYEAYLNIAKYYLEKVKRIVNSIKRE